MASASAVDIVRRHENAGLAVTDHLAAAGHIGGDDRTGAGGRFEQRLRHALAIGRRQHGDRRAAPDRPHIRDRAEPFDPRLGGERAPAFPRSANRDCRDRSGPASSNSIGMPRAAQAGGSRRPRRARPCSRSMRETSATVTIGAVRIGQRGEMAGIDPRSSDQRDPLRIDPEPDERGAVLRVLHDDPAPVPPAARRSPTAERRPAQPAPKPASEKPEPSPMTESIDDRGARRAARKARRRAMPPNSTGFSATWWTRSGRSAR